MRFHQIFMSNVQSWIQWCRLRECWLKTVDKNPLRRFLWYISNFLIAIFKWWRWNISFSRKKISEIEIPKDGKNEDEIGLSKTDPWNINLLLIYPDEMHDHGFVLYFKWRSTNNLFFKKMFPLMKGLQDTSMEILNSKASE